jgi:hypothetical protein
MLIWRKEQVPISVQLLKSLLVVSFCLPLTVSAQESPQPLSKKFRRAAVVAISSLDNWENAADRLLRRADVSGSETHVFKTDVDKLEDAKTKMEQDIKLAAIEAETTGDRATQKLLQEYQRLLALWSSEWLKRRTEGAPTPSNVLARVLVSTKNELKAAVDTGIYTPIRTNAPRTSECDMSGPCAH